MADNDGSNITTEAAKTAVGVAAVAGADSLVSALSFNGSHSAVAKPTAVELAKYNKPDCPSCELSYSPAEKGTSFVRVAGVGLGVALGVATFTKWVKGNWKIGTAAAAIVSAAAGWVFGRDDSQQR
jgi:hypothetical protein